MPIIQINVWTCEVCTRTEGQINPVAPYDDPIVTPPTSGWGYINPGQVGKEKLACPECMRLAEPKEAGNGA